MTRRFAAIAFLLVGGVGLPDAAAQRSGIWIENGLGTGAARISCAGCTDATVAYGGTSYLRLGARLSDRVHLGAEVFAFNDKAVSVAGTTEPPIEAESAAITAMVLWYPGASGAFLKGGIGLARGTFTVPPPAGGRLTTTGTGSALTFGVGLDLPVFRWFALTANLATFISAIGDVALPTIAIDDVIATTYHASLGLTLR